ncbi:MAG: acyl CoA:acetate/3-ketoacid CoA transferase [Caldilineae bacterium]|nr:MAG: acyl CoA:acetate/3-ketoacid CoA transferase [Caldilineae bacterium]
MSKVISAAEAVALIRDGDCVAVQGSGGGVAEPTALLRALGERYQAQAAPRALTLFHATGLGDQKEIGLDYLAYPGLVKRDIAGHLGMAPKMAQLIRADQVESYNFPQGVLSHMYGAVASGKPGVITKVGLHTYVDPRLEGGKMNASATADLVRLLELDGEEWLYFPRIHMDVALVRGTTADLKGNISCEQEAALLEGLAIAQAVKACGGVVIAQVKRLAQPGSLHPQQVRIPGIFVDYVVVDEGQWQTVAGEYNPSFSGEIRIPLEELAPLPLDVRKVIARRAAQELFPGAVVNLGFGMPSGVASVAAEQGLLEQITFTVEQGLIGGLPAGGVIFGVAYNPEAMIGEDAQFAFYDGAGVDLAFLGMAQADRAGNINVSKVGSLLAGCGGFINITQNAKKVVFCGAFTAKGLDCQVEGGRLHIRREGAIRKFVEQVEQITFSGAYARQRGQPVLYVTERAVFELVPEGLLLREIAPGVDLHRDVLGQMDFTPLLADDLRRMEAGLFGA